MKIRVKMDVQAALKNGLDVREIEIVTFSPAEIPEVLRGTLVAHSQSADREYDLNAYGCSHNLCSLRSADQAGLIVALREQQAADEVERKKDAARMAAATGKFMAESDEHWGQVSDYEWAHVGDLDRTQPEVVSKIARVVVLREQREAAEKIERERKEEEKHARRAQEEAADQARRATMMDWGREKGSELLKARIEEGMNWVGLARQEYALAQAPEAGYRTDICADEKRENATLEEIQALRAARAAMAGAGKTGEVELGYEPAGKGVSLEIIVRCPDDFKVRIGRWLQEPETTEQDEEDAE